MVFKNGTLFRLSSLYRLRHGARRLPRQP
jgi:hypothetical protein